MTLGLRARLFGAMALVIFGLLAAVGFFTRATVRHEFQDFVMRRDAVARSRALSRFQDCFRVHDAWSGCATTLERVLDEDGQGTVVVDADGRVIVRHPAALAAWTIEVDGDGGLRLTRVRGRTATALALRGPAGRVSGQDGRDGGLVFLLPAHVLDEEREPGLANAGTLGGSIDRWLLPALAVALVAALVLTASVVRRVLAPVGALTEGARALAGGRLDTRVPADRPDELGALARSFNAMAEALERNEAARRDQVSDVAHELRTPLASARARLEAAQDGLLPADAAFLASLHEDIGALSRLVEDLQQLSLAQAGALRLAISSVPLAGAVARVLDAAAPEASRRGLALRADVPDGIAARADGDRVRQVVRNLVANALAHARSDVVVSALRSGARVEVRVADDGPGVPPEAAARVFDRFFRADASRSRATGGSGLGLAIARQLAALMDGTLALENRPGEGATFVLTLPAA